MQPVAIKSLAIALSSTVAAVRHSPAFLPRSHAFGPGGVTRHQHAVRRRGNVPRFLLSGEGTVAAATTQKREVRSASLADARRRTSPSRRSAPLNLSSSFGGAISPLATHRVGGRGRGMTSSATPGDPIPGEGGGRSERFEDVEERKRLDGKIDPTVSTGVFLATVGLGVPVCVGLILPITLVYQGWKAAFGRYGSGGGEEARADGTPSKGDAGLDDATPFPTEAELIPLPERKYDLVLLGATGFTGRLAASYLFKTYGVGGKIKWAIAGRSRDKLEQVKSEIAKETGSEDVMKVESIIVDTNNRETIHGLVKDTRAVASTAGPFALYGSNVVEFCAKYGTNYVDITGEADWTKEMIMKWDGTAQRTGSKLVSFSGHDCVPWDLTVHKLSELLATECQDDLVSVECLDEMRAGGVSGGTVATILGAIDGTSVPRYEFDPLLKMPDGSKSEYRTKVKNQLLVGKPSQGRFSSRWVAPFVMAAINGEIVKRSTALRSKGNLSITYKEAWLVKDFKTAFVNSFGLYAAVTALLNPITGGLLRRFIIPKPGEGPSKKAMDHGYLCIYGLGIGSKGNTVESAMYFPRDAGYQDTARILVESGLCLALDGDELPVQQGGFFTPSTGMGNVLLNRLCKTGTVFRSRVVDNSLRSKL